jgi:uncharacterized protein (DUF1800 family)
MTTQSDLQNAATALNRFGLGARPDELLPADPKGWLLAQFSQYQPLPAAWADKPTSSALVMSYTAYLREQRAARANNEQATRKKLGELTQMQYRAAVNARVTSALDTPAPFAERMVHFWANHFAVSTDKNPVGLLAGSFELEAIRPHVFGRFQDMLLAVEAHPAMLLYLDQARSIGPDSMVARRAAQRPNGVQRGLNENLAREILELHTLGVHGGYSQADVTEFARALTGWSLGGLLGLPAQNEAGGFTFQMSLHEPGVRTVCGKTYDQRGQAQGLAILHDLGSAPATARFVATKLARHFAGDVPPPALVERLTATFLRTEGDLPSLYRTLIESPETWVAGPLKFKTPWEWTISSLRGLGLRSAGERQFAPLLTQLGQPAWRPGSPAGFDDIAASWAAPDALIRRVETAQRMAEQVAGTIDARTLAPRLLPGGLSETTTQTIARAESQPIALALLFAAPEFLRR